MSTDKDYIEIDISMDVFDVCYSDGSHNQFENTKNGFLLFGKTLTNTSFCVM